MVSVYLHYDKPKLE